MRGDFTAWGHGEGCAIAFSVETRRQLFKRIWAITKVDLSCVLMVIVPIQNPVVEKKRKEKKSFTEKKIPSVNNLLSWIHRNDWLTLGLLSIYYCTSSKKKLIFFFFLKKADFSFKGSITIADKITQKCYILIQKFMGFHLLAELLFVCFKYLI